MRESALSLRASSAKQVRAIGAGLAASLLRVDPAAPFVVGLSGELGAGKTTLVGGLLAALGHEGPARSPTYSLIEPYRLSGRDVHHCDLYRLRDPEELDDLGLRDLLVDRAVLLVEWPERADARLPTPDLALQIHYADDGRKLGLRAGTAAGAQVLTDLGSTLPDELVVSS